MSRKHYVEIAKALSQVPDSEMKTEIIKAIIPVFKNDNPNFRPFQFANACAFKPATSES